MRFLGLARIPGQEVGAHQEVGQEAASNNAISARSDISLEYVQTYHRSFKGIFQSMNTRHLRFFTDLLQS